MTLRRIAFAVIAVILAAGPGRADVVVGNLGDFPAGAFGLVPGSTTDVAQQFTTGIQGFDLTDIQATVGGVRNLTSGAAYLLSDSGGSPGSLVANLNFSASDFPALGVGVVTFTPSSPVMLTADTTYWFALGDRDSIASRSSFGWSVTFSGAVLGPGSIGDYAKSSDEGQTWNGPFSDARGLIQVDGTPTAVPEPSSALVVGFAALAWLGVCKWKPGRKPNAGRSWS
jgi:hypothetical protein